MTKKDKLNLSYYIREFNLENDMRLNLDLENSHLIEKLPGKYIYIKIDVPNMGSFESLGQKMNKLEDFLITKLGKPVQFDGEGGLIITLE
jgi:hypothetical protein